MYHFSSVILAGWNVCSELYVEDETSEEYGKLSFSRSTWENFLKYDHKRSWGCRSPYNCKIERLGLSRLITKL
jgi:hypothetical protein